MSDSLSRPTSKLDLAICGGGHSASGASSTEGGLVIDMGKKMNGVRVDTEKKVACVQGGALWGDVDAASMKHGLVALGGVVNHTGVGGLTVGGGYGWLTGQHGMVIDNLVSATVVTASGEILAASDTENIDLFWAIRGGGSNFGPVTEFVYKLHEQRADVYITSKHPRDSMAKMHFLIFPGENASQILDEIEQWRKSQSNKEALHLLFVAGPDGKPCVLLMAMYNGSLKEGEGRFNRFAALGPAVNKSRMMPYPEINALQNHATVHGKNRLLRGVFVPGFDKELFLRVEPARQKMVAEYPSTASSAIALESYHAEKVASVSVEATAYAGRNTHLNLCLILNWDDDKLTPQVRELSRSVVHSIVGKETGTYSSA
ncbi:hypothetical protein BOTBODRAFT_146774, partial [Botryobasidium botryosum FD-172 SS1]